MPSALVTALAAPIREVQSLVGPGWSDGHALDRARESLAEVSRAARRAWTQAETDWTGAGADAAAAFAAATVEATETLRARVTHLGTTAQSAAAAVARANERLQHIVERFEGRAAALEPYLDSPAAEKELLAEAQRSLAEAVAVVDELRSELDGHAATVRTQ